MITDQFTEEEFKAFYQRLRRYIEAEKVADDIELIAAAEAERERWTRKYAELEALYKSLLDTMVEQRHMVPPPPVIAENAGPAVTAERERCAQIVLSLIEDGDEAEACAAAIRRGE